MGTLVQMLKITKDGDKVITPLLMDWLMKRNRMPTFLHPDVAKYVTRLIPPRTMVGRFSPSGAGGCHRHAVLGFRGEPEERRTTPKSQMIYDDGHYRHLRFHSYLCFMSDDPDTPLKSLGFEVPTKFPSWNVIGTLDHIIEVNDVRYIVDFKGANNWVFERVKRTQQAMTNHINQLVIYCRAKNVYHGIVLYDNKNTQEIEEIVVEITSEMVQAQRDRIRKLQRYVRDGILPPIPKECKLGNYMMEKCGHANFCYPMEDVEEIE